MVRGALVLLLGVAACGRFDFDDRPPGEPDPDDAAAAVDAPACGVPEVCNGLDDDCDGQIDEGCACAEFSTTIGNSVFDRGIVSLGTGYAGLVGGNLVVLGADGAIAQSTPFPADAGGNVKQGLAWNGTTLAFWDAGSGDGRIGTVATDGTGLAFGPSLGGSGWNQGLVRWNGSGYDVVASSATGPLTFLRTDASGAPLGTPAVGAMATSIGVVGEATLDGSPIVLWREQTASTDAELGLPAPPAMLTSQAAMGAAGGVTSWDFASDGARVLVASGNQLWSYDAQHGAVNVPAMWQGVPASVARAGDGWDLAILPSPAFSSPQQLQRIHLDATLTVTGNEILASLPVVSSFGTTAPTVIGDARRSLIVWWYQVDAGTPQGVAYQRCF